VPAGDIRLDDDNDIVERRISPLLEAGRERPLA
jgi:hypothetical protein